jgi:hypothetical protein
MAAEALIKICEGRTIIIGSRQTLIAWRAAAEKEIKRNSAPLMMWGKERKKERKRRNARRNKLHRDNNEARFDFANRQLGRGMHVLHQSIAVS